jgi:GNAT superfamily N-acetyltransferase
MVARVSTDAEILATRDVMRQLRPQLSPDAYLSTIRRLERTDGYRLAVSADGSDVRAVAGYRIMELLWCGRVLYVDDLSTDERHRSQGHGKTLVDWLTEEARSLGCVELHLDSGVQREAAHRFYFREGFAIRAYHFRRAL